MDTNGRLALPADLALLHSQRHDRALGLPRPGARTLALSAYRARRQQAAMDGLAKAAFYRAVIQECQARVEKLVRGARTRKQRRKALQEVERLNALAEKAAAQLEALSG